MKFVCAGAEIIDRKLRQRQRNLSHRLHCIGMKIHTFAFCDCSKFRDWFYGSDFVISCHNGNERCIRSYCIFQFFRIYHTVIIHLQISHVIPQTFQIFTGTQYCMVLNLTRNNMLSLLLFCTRHIFYHPVIRFASSRCKKNFLGMCIQPVCDFFSCVFHCFLCPLPHPIRCRCIAIFVHEIGVHRFAHLRKHIRGGRMIHINFTTHILSPSFIR